MCGGGCEAGDISFHLMFRRSLAVSVNIPCTGGGCSIDDFFFVSFESDQADNLNNLTQGTIVLYINHRQTDVTIRKKSSKSVTQFTSSSSGEHVA